MNLNAQKIVNISQILNGKGGTELLNKMLNQRSRRTRNETIIDIDKYINKM